MSEGLKHITAAIFHGSDHEFRHIIRFHQHAIVAGILLGHDKSLAVVAVSIDICDIRACI